MSKKATIQKTSAMVLAALMCAAPVQASETGLSEWVSKLIPSYGAGGGGGDPGVDPALSATGAGGGGGHPGVDPVLSTTGAGGGGGNPGVKPD